MQNLKSDDEKPAVLNSMLDTPHSAPGTHSPITHQNVQNPKSDDKKRRATPPEESAASAPSCENQNLMTKNHGGPFPSEEGQAAGENVPFVKFDDKNDLARFAELRAQILHRQELIVRDSTVVASWITYQGRRLGPYYRVAFREQGKLRAIYIGRDEKLATMASALIDELKEPREQQRILRQLRRTIRAGLRRSLREAEIHAAPLGYRRRGFSFHKQK